MPVDASCFSPDYVAARARFRSGALALGAQLTSHGIDQTGPDGEELTIDMAVLGEPGFDRAVVVSSGIHGIEGFVGSAIQAAILEDRLPSARPPGRIGVVMLHALNPYGFAFLRRVNEDNVDLNRNFLLPGEAYSGAPDGYAALDGMLNPTTPPTTLEPFLLKAVLQIARHGLPALKNAVAGGQYDFPKGVFFGGHGPSRTQTLLGEIMPPVVGKLNRVYHIDFHSGLGKPATYKLLVDHEGGSPGAEALIARFGDDVQPWEKSGVSYAIRGGLGTWCKHKFGGDRYDVLAAEFGTVSILKVISGTRTENRAHHWGGPDHPWTARAKEEFRDIFAPRDRDWRDRVVASGVRIFDQAVAALS